MHVPTGIAVFVTLHVHVPTGIVEFVTLHVHVPTVELFLCVTATPSTQQAGGKSRTNTRAQTDGQADRQTDRDEQSSM